MSDTVQDQSQTGQTGDAGNQAPQYRWQVLDNSGNNLGFIEAQNPQQAQQLGNEKYAGFNQLGACESLQNGSWMPTTFSA